MNEANLGWAGKHAMQHVSPSLTSMLTHKSPASDSSFRINLSYSCVVHNGVQTCPSSSYIADVVG